MRYYIVDIADGSVTKTDSMEVISDFLKNEDYIVIDKENDEEFINEYWQQIKEKKVDTTTEEDI